MNRLKNWKAVEEMQGVALSGLPGASHTDTELNSYTPTFYDICLSCHCARNVGVSFESTGPVSGYCIYSHVINTTTPLEMTLQISSPILNSAWLLVLNFFQRGSSLGLSYLYFKLMFPKLKSCSSIPN